MGMRTIPLAIILLAGPALAQQQLDANSIVVTSYKYVVLIPSEVTFMVTVSADVGSTLDQVLTAVDLGLTAQDLTGIYSYPAGVPYAAAPNASRANYTFRLAVPLTRMKETVEKLDKLRKTLDTGMDLSYTASAVAPTQAAVLEMRDKVLPELVAEARKRAEVLAAAAQLKLGAIQSVSEPYAYTGSPTAPASATMTFSLTVRFQAQ